MVLCVQQVYDILRSAKLLRGDIQEKNLTFQSLSYHSGKCEMDTLFFCKGQYFREDYLKMAIDKGSTAYVTEVPRGYESQAAEILVENVDQAMALLSAAFYEHPEKELYIIGITGTKGKTSTAYLTYYGLNAVYPGKVALFSTQDRILSPEIRFKSHLSTPEPTEIYHDMRVARDAGVTHLVMEVSSQAYKRNRVFGLSFDVGMFLNISPDHIGKNEHEDFQDYLHCKLMLLENSQTCLVHADLADFHHDIESACGDKKVLWIAPKGENGDICYSSILESYKQSVFSLEGVSPKGEALGVAGEYALQVAGSVNQGNASLAVAAGRTLGAPRETLAQGISEAVIPGRMEVLETSHGVMIVDYAHNYLGLKTLLTFVREQSPEGVIRVIIGSSGNKAANRRAGIGQALSEFADEAILTTDDAGYEDPVAIAEEIKGHITNAKIRVQIIPDRKLAIQTAVASSHKQDVLVMAGKGAEFYQVIKGVDVPYESDEVNAKVALKSVGGKVLT